LHRWLEAGAHGFARHAERPLELDLLVIDEMSMLDLALMQALLSALLRAVVWCWLVIRRNCHPLGVVRFGIACSNPMSENDLGPVRFTSSRRIATVELWLNWPVPYGRVGSTRFRGVWLGWMLRRMFGSTANPPAGCHR
jgi:hypothetical protein